MTLPYYLDSNTTVLDFYPGDANDAIFSNYCPTRQHSVDKKRSISDILKAILELQQILPQSVSREFLRTQFQKEIVATNVTNVKIFQKLKDYGYKAIESINRIPLSKASITIISEDTLIIKFAYKSKFEISTIQSFDEDEDENAALVAFLEGDKIVFQQEIPLETLVERILKTLK